MRKKHLPHVIYIVIILFFGVYAKLQTTYAREEQLKNKEMTAMAKIAQERAQNEAQRAEQAAAEARIAQRKAERAMQELKECRAK